MVVTKGSKRCAAASADSPSPLSLTAGQQYVISVNRNAFYPLTAGGLGQEIIAGPIASVVGSNGVFDGVAGNFPSGSFNNSNYFADLVVAPEDGTVTTPPPAPTVDDTTPAAGATAVAIGASPTATFSRAMNPATMDGQTATLTVRDRGPGFAAGETERLFEPFFRGQASRGAAGAGLGLSICRGIVEAHGGQIQARNREGGGAEFVVTIPAAPPPDVPEETP